MMSHTCHEPPSCLLDPKAKSNPLQVQDSGGPSALFAVPLRYYAEALER